MQEQIPVACLLETYIKQKFLRGQNFVHYFQIPQYFVPNYEQHFYVKFSGKILPYVKLKNAFNFPHSLLDIKQSYSHNLSVKVPCEHCQNPCSFSLFF